MITIRPRTGTAFEIKKGQYLKVVCPKGEQVADLVAFNPNEYKEFLSNGKTFDYEEGLRLTTGNRLYSNMSNVMLEIMEDICGIHDFLLSPCCPKTMEIFYGINEEVPTCWENLYLSLRQYGIERWSIPTAFNIFMNVPISHSGKIMVLPPTAKPGDYIVFLAHMDLLIGLTACSAAASNNGTFKEIAYSIYG